MLWLSACSVHPVVRAGAPPIASALTPETTVLMLVPRIRFERIELGGTFSSRGSSTEQLSASLLNAAREAIDGAHARPIGCDGAAQPEPATSCQALDTEAKGLLRGTVTPVARSALERVSADAPQCRVLVTSLVAELGPPESYEALTNQPRADLSKSTFHAALLRCDTGAVIWRNDVLLREPPDVADTHYFEAVRLLYGGAGALE